MGTRSMHFFPSLGNVYQGQYLQFDGYPSNQMYRIMSEIKVLSKLCDKNVPRQFKLDYLEHYYRFRSYDSDHSIRNNGSLYSFIEYEPDTGVYKKDDVYVNTKELLENMWVEYIYQWVIDIEEPELRITHVSSGNTISCKIKDLSDSIMMSVTLPDGKSINQKVAEFSDKIDGYLESSE